MRKLKLINPNYPSSDQIEKYFKLARESGLYSNFGMVYNLAVSKLNATYPNLFPVLLNNGTTAIQVAVKTLLPAGSRVAIPSFTFTATLQAVIAAHCKPIIFQSNPYSWLMDPNMLLEHKDLYDAFIVVAPFGYSVDVDLYDNIAKELGKPVIYDFAAAFGTRISHNYPTTFSFHATKNVPIGEGGAVMFPSENLQTSAKQLINFDFEPNRFPKSVYGLNGKLDELHCSVLCAQLDRLPELFKHCIYTSNIHEILKQHSFTFAFPHDGQTQLNSAYCQLPTFGVSTSLIDSFEEHLKRSGVEFKRYYYPYLNEAFPQEVYISNPDFEGKGLYGEDVTLALARISNKEDYDYLMAVIDGWLEGDI